jgi:hypothetical protein
MPDGDSIRIVDLDVKFLIGWADLGSKRYPVKTAQGDTLAVVSSIQDAIPILLDHYERHPAQWDQDSATEYSKDTPFGLLSVVQDPVGFWSACRNEHTLCQNSKPAIFGTAEDGKAAADRHFRDDAGALSKDGLAWFSIN